MKTNKKHKKAKKTDITRETFWLRPGHKSLISLIIKSYRREFLKVSRSEVVRGALIDLATMRGVRVSKELV